MGLNAQYYQRHRKTTRNYTTVTRFENVIFRVMGDNFQHFRLVHMLLQTRELHNRRPWALLLLYRISLIPWFNWESLSYLRFHSLIHYTDVIMSANLITDVSIVCSVICSGVYQRKHQSSASLACVRGIHRWPVNSPHKWPVTRKIFPFDDVIMPRQILCHVAKFVMVLAVVTAEIFF